MASRVLTVKIPQWTANLLPNVLGFLGLATICVALGSLTDWRWATLLAGVFATLLAVWMQYNAPAEEPTPPATARTG